MSPQATIHAPTDHELGVVWAVSRDLLGIADASGRWLKVNPAWTASLGWSEVDLVGRTSAWLHHPDDHRRDGWPREALAAGRVVETSEQLRARDGRYRTLSWRVVPVDGLVYATGRDVTDDEAGDKALSDLRDFSRLALEAVDGVGAWTFDVASDRFTCDAAVCELYDIDVGQGTRGIPREGFLANVHPDDRAALVATMREGLQRRGDLELEYRILHRDGTIRSVLSRGHTYFDSDGRPVRRTGVSIETTRRRQLEEQLRQSQKMEAVGQLTGGLAHDFNNLLTGIGGSLELLQIRLSQGRIHELDRYVIAAQGAAKRAATLTHRLLAFSRRQTLEPKVVDVDRLVAGIEDLIRRTIGPEIELAPLRTVDDLWPTLVDPGQLENALLNLCINARDAMPGGGRLTIETGCVRLADVEAAALELPPGPYVTLAVGDSGIGMSAAVVARAFDPFFTTKPIGMGTGLGLSMVYGFAKQSHGQVRIRSEVGKGTTVTLHLPSHTGDGAATDVEEPSAPSSHPAHHETVLVVDDEPTVRLLVRDTLEDHGYRVVEAVDGLAGLRLLESSMRIDLLVTDVGMPGGLNGRQLADAARRARPDLKVLFITGYAEHAVLGDGHADADLHVLTKPFAVRALIDRVERLVGTG